MRELKRSSSIIDKIKLGDEVIEINLSTADIVKRFRAVHLDILHAEQEVKKLRNEGITKENMADAFETYGNAILKLFELIFGEENTAKIVKFYESNYEEMAIEVTPYINEVIVPKIQAAGEEQKARAKQKYGGKTNGVSRFFK